MESKRGKGRPPLPIKKIAVSTKLDEDKFDAFVDYCNHVKRSQAWVLREALEFYLETVQGK